MDKEGMVEVKAKVLEEVLDKTKKEELNKTMVLGEELDKAKVVGEEKDETSSDLLLSYYY